MCSETAAGAQSTLDDLCGPNWPSSDGAIVLLDKICTMESQMLHHTIKHAQKLYDSPPEFIEHTFTRAVTPGTYMQHGSNSSDDCICAIREMLVMPDVRTLALEWLSQPVSAETCLLCSNNPSSFFHTPLHMCIRVRISTILNSPDFHSSIHLAHTTTT